jgi:hypothetical protein
LRRRYHFRRSHERKAALFRPTNGIATVAERRRVEIVVCAAKGRVVAIATSRSVNHYRGYGPSSGTPSPRRPSNTWCERCSVGAHRFVGFTIGAEVVAYLAACYGPDPGHAIRFT